jgi:hypothetical protein
MAPGNRIDQNGTRQLDRSKRSISIPQAPLIRISPGNSIDQTVKTSGSVARLIKRPLRPRQRTEGVLNHQSITNTLDKVTSQACKVPQDTSPATAAAHSTNLFAGHPDPLAMPPQADRRMGRVSLFNQASGGLTLSSS